MIPYGIFTFHYVSIKSLSVYIVYMHIANLHSTMYLLNLNNANYDAFWANPFTFHYVSIKSTYLSVSNGDDIYLHSTMYLLNLWIAER